MLGTNHEGSVRGVGLAVLVLCVAACKSEGRKESPGASAKPADGTPLQRGGMVKLPSNEPKYLNPILEPRFIVANSLIFEGLVGLDAKLEPVERLAQSWTISEDGRTLTFKLRDNVKWHDGEKLTSADVAFTFEAIRATEAATAWQAYMAPVQELTTPDERTVVVTYAEPYAPALVTWTVGILPEHKFVKPGDTGPLDLAAAHANLEPVGTGPFKYSRWELGKRLLLEANRDWWHKRPHLDGLELVFGLGDADTIAALQGGGLDWAKINDVGSWLDIAQTGDFREKFEASEVVEARIRLIAWNTRRSPLDDKRVRKALTYALDRSRVISDVLFGQAASLAAPMFPNMFAHDASIAPLPFDLDAARALLDEAAPAKKNGTRFAIEVISVDSFRGSATDGMAAIFARDLATLGIDFKLTLLPHQAYYERIAKRDYDGVYFGWLPDIPDPDPAALLHSSQAPTGANYAVYASAEVDRLVEEARRTLDRAARKKLYRQLQQVLAEEMPYTPLYAPYGHYAWTRRLRGVTPRDIGPQAPMTAVAGWWLDKP